MTKNSIHGLRNTEISIQSKRGLIEKMVRAYWEANERAYISATTDPRTGLTDAAKERAVALMILG